jgi:predicted GH43/DUF377 family glycosyl hydrolase
MASHAANPFGAWLEDGMLGIYFTSRDTDNRSHIGFAKADPQRGFSIISVSPEPVLRPGEPGLFDDSGVAMGCILEVNGRQLGWNLKVTVPWLNTIGLAIGNDKTRQFRKWSRAPVMDRSEEDPFSISYPSILHENGTYRMWYGSNLHWGKTQDEMDHVIKYAESNDGFSWKRSGNIAVDLMHPNEYAISKPFVLKSKDGHYTMFYSYRGNGEVTTYRIGHAVSRDGLHWTRKDADTGIDVSTEGWDSEMICYPFVFEYGGETYMFYNGNGYGRTGFGLARLEDA